MSSDNGFRYRYFSFFVRYEYSWQISSTIPVWNGAAVINTSLHLHNYQVSWDGTGIAGATIGTILRETCIRIGCYGCIVIGMH